MSGLHSCFVKFIILLLYISQTHCDEANDIEPIPGVFFYDSTQEDLLFKIVKEIYNNTSKIEDMLTTLNQLEQKLSTLSEQVNELIQKSNNSGNEACMEIDRKFDEFKVSQNDKTSIILQQIKETNQNLDNAKAAVNTKLEKIDENLLQVKTESEKFSISLHDMDSTLGEVKKEVEKETKLLEHLNDIKYELKDPPIAPELPDDPVLNDRNESSPVYSCCKEALKHNRSSGVYSLRSLNPKFPTFNAYCFKDRNDNKHAWTILERRDKHSGHTIDFNRTWEEYKNGFGDLEYDHFLGLEIIYSLTNSGRYELWELWINENKEKDEAYYDDFKISNETENYKLISVGNKRIGGSLDECIGKPFNTFDRGDTKYVEACGGGGFWGPCRLNYNRQYRSKKGEINIDHYSFGLGNYYLHLALRPKSTKKS